jgi:raffinose/stachyose/melibiose transport system permease protein
MAGRGGILTKSTVRRRRALAGLVFVTPALLLYGWLVLGSFGSAIQYSLYDWNGVGQATFVGFANYVDVLTSPARLVSLLHAFQLMIFFCGVTITLALAAAVLTRAAVGRRSAAAVRTILFMPQVIPIVAAAVGWSWIYSRDGALNQFLDAVGLSGITRAWLGDPATALAAIGFIGTWALLGLVTMMLTAGISKIDTALYEAARLDGANPVQEFFAVTLPGLRRELVVCATLTIIAALASFDIVYITTQGGPNRATIVPGIDIYNLAFGQQQVGGAAAMGILLMGVVLLVVIPLQRLAAKD